MKPMEIKKPTEKDEDTMKFTNLTTKTQVHDYIKKFIGKGRIDK